MGPSLQPLSLVHVDGEGCGVYFIFSPQPLPPQHPNCQAVWSQLLSHFRSSLETGCEFRIALLLFSLAVCMCVGWGKYNTCLSLNVSPCTF